MARIYKCTIHCHTGSGALVQPGCHYQTDVADIGSEPDPDDVAQRFWEHLDTSFRNAVPGSLTIDEAVVVEQVVPPAIGVVGAFPISSSGTWPQGDTFLPNELVPLINLHTNVHSRSARGWQFLASPKSSNALESDSTWSATFFQWVQGYANLLATNFGVGDINVTTCKPVVYSRTRHARNQSPWVFPVSSAIAKQAPTWLRSRHSAP